MKPIAERFWAIALTALCLVLGCSALFPTAPKSGVHRVPICTMVTDTIANTLPTGPRFYTITHTVCT